MECGDVISAACFLTLPCLKNTDSYRDCLDMSMSYAFFINLVIMYVILMLGIFIVEKFYGPL
jgi:hypothetical protein